MIYVFDVESAEKEKDMSNNYEPILRPDNDQSKLSQSHPRIVEIPVQHVKSSSTRESSPIVHQPPYLLDDYKDNYPTTFHNRSLFDRFDSPFGNLKTFC